MLESSAFVCLESGNGPFHRLHRPRFTKRPAKSIGGTRETPKAMTYYDNIMSNRHLVAHQSGTNITLAELETAFSESKVVFQALADALSLTPDETKDF